MMLREVAGGVTLAVRAQPVAKKTAIVGVYGEGDRAQWVHLIQAACMASGVSVGSCCLFYLGYWLSSLFSFCCRTE